MKSLLRCPACRGELLSSANELQCQKCRRRFPILGNGVPVLIDEAHSVFTIDGFRSDQPTFFKPHGRLFRALKALLPEVSIKPNTLRNCRALRDRLLAEHRRRVLVIGGSIRGIGVELFDTADFELVETDASHGPHTALICDAHSIPFADHSFDAVIAQCVLEHVIDPDRCVNEMHRVLKPHGLVYAETAFMQQVHGGAYDFCRYSELGHRRLFRRFEQIDSGAVSGPATALAWSYEHLLLSFVRRERLRYAVKAFARLSAFFLKYLDYFLIDRPGALDAASAVYFLGTKSEHTLADRDLLALYRGNG